MGPAGVGPRRGRGRRYRGGAAGGGGEKVAKRSNTRAKVVVRVDLPALLRGRPVEGEVGEVAGGGAGGGVRAAGAVGHRRSLLGRGGDQGQEGGGCGPRGASAQRPPADGAGVVLARGCRAGLSQRVVPPDRPPPGPGPQPPHRGGPPRPASAPTTTTSRRGPTGPWCPAPASGTSSRPTTPATRGTRTDHRGREGAPPTDDFLPCRPSKMWRARGRARRERRGNRP